MESVLSGRNLILELSLKVDEKKTCFFRGGRKLKAPKLDLAQRELIPYYCLFACFSYHMYEIDLGKTSTPESKSGTKEFKRTIKVPLLMCF